MLLKVTEQLPGSYGSNFNCSGAASSLIVGCCFTKIRAVKRKYVGSQ